MNVQLDAIQLRSGEWVVKPEGQLGTCGSYPFLWTAQFVKKARGPESAKAQVQKYFNQEYQRQLSHKVSKRCIQ